MQATDKNIKYDLFEGRINSINILITYKAKQNLLICLLSIYKIQQTSLKKKKKEDIYIRCYNKKITLNFRGVCHFTLHMYQQRMQVFIIGQML